MFLRPIFVSHLIAASAALCCVTVRAEPTSALPPSSTQAIMDSIFEPLSETLALSFEQEAFSRAANRTRVQAQLDKLAANVGHLEEHAQSQDRTFEFVAKSLGRDARRLASWYRKGRFDEARFTLHNMTDNCIACHSSLPQTKAFPRAARFLQRIDISKLHPIERATLQVTTRQFDDALTSYESLFDDKKNDPALAVSLGAMSDYLKLCIDVKSDFRRPQALLQRMRNRPTTPLHVRMQLDKWIAALRDFDVRAVLTSSKPVETAHKVLNDARAMMEFPRDRDALVHFVTAEAILARYIHSHPDRGNAVGEAYYMRGIAENLLEHSFWLSRSEFYFESAIRLAPAADFAPKAYAMLTESLTANFSGSSGTKLEPEAEDLLAELKTIIEQARGGRI